MSEGELKKRLVQLKPQSEVEAMLGYALKVNTSTVEKVLAEAKKEFPQTYKEEETFNGVDGYLVNTPIPKELKLWFKKWFGSEQK